MNNNIAIKLTNISKKYVLHHEKPTLMENIFKFGKKEEIWALKDINLEIKKGEKIGIIGDNGSGKTTLLKIITGITSPTSGQVQVNGRVAALIDLEAGFHPELTGEENTYINGMILGMTKQEVRKKLNKIVEFSGLRKFIDLPIYAYSKGMKLRLGFSIAIHADPNILLIDDETMWVGDKSFQRKIQKKIQDFQRSGGTFIIVTHWLKYLEKNVENIIFLQKGKIKTFGPAKSVIKFYQRIKNVSDFV